jgi:hypothetical protein
MSTYSLRLRLPTIYSYRLPIAIAAALLAVAVGGYLAGHGRSAGPSKERTLTASTASVLFAYPSSWQPLATAPQIPGLSLASPVVLAPPGQGSHAGLLAGALAGGEPSPLPRKFLAGMGQLPATAVVNLLEAQAYRYAWPTTPGLGAKLTLYVIPNPGGQASALACYATAALAATMQECEHIVTTLKLVGQTQSYDLMPESAYARGLSTSIAALDAERNALRRELGSRPAPEAVLRAAARLASGFATAAASLSALVPSLVTGQPQAALSGSILQARDAYAALAAAGPDPSRFALARTKVYEAERSVNAALESFALLGYAQA